MAELKYTIGSLIVDKTTDQGHEVNLMPQVERVTNENGRTEGHRWTILLEGNVIDAATGLPATVMNGFVAIVEQITTAGEVAFETQLDGAVVDGMSFTPSECFWGPYVTHARLISDEGNFDGHARYSFTVQAFVKQGNGYDIDTELIEKQNTKGDVVFKSWTVNAKDKDVTAALQVCLSFQPSGKDITQEIRRRKEQSECTAIWVWNARREGIFKRWVCEVKITPAGPDFIVVKQAEGSPVLHEVLPDVSIVEVRGYVELYSPDTPGISEHYSPSDKIKRVPRRETEHMIQPAVLSEEEGLYFWRYHEVYLIEGDPELPNHSNDHHLIEAGSLSAPPGDGAMG